METLSQLIELGTQLGLKDTDLQNFVSNEQAKAREERELERSYRQAKEQREHELKMEQEKKVSQELEREWEREREKWAISEHERRLVLLEVEEKKEKVSMPAAEVGSSVTRVKGPKLSPFEEASDNMDAYLRRFERYAEAQKWHINQWGAHLSALLKGRALDVFSRMPPEQALNFEELKKALLKRFELTEEGFRKKFRSCRPEGGETFRQFADRIESYFDRWLEMSQTDRTYVSLKDLMLRDQFIQCCGKELSLFLKERVPKSIDDMAKLADQFAEARETPSLGVSDVKPKVNRGGFNNVAHDKKSGFRNTTQNDKRSDRRCYKCNKLRHLSFECPERKNPSNKAQSLLQNQDTGKGDRFQDDETGHGAPSSRNFRGRGRGRGNLYRGRGGFEGSSLVLDSTHQLSVSCDVSVETKSTMPVVNGRVGGKVVTVLRDTGCSGVVVRKNLVPLHEFTGNTEVCTLADGTKVTVPTACIDIDTPYLKGRVVAWCMEKPVYDIILGNVDNVRPPNDPDPFWKERIVSAVQTRAQRREAEKPYKPLKVPESFGVKASRDEIKIEQERDETLNRLRTLASSGDVKELKCGGFSKLFVKRGLIYREFSSPNVSSGKVHRQLVVPLKYRQTVMQLAHDSIMAGHLGLKKSLDRVLAEFYWPGVQADMGRYCKSCDICQRTFPKGRVTRVPLGSMPLIDEPFQRIAVDIVGPFQPVTDRGNRFILTIIDYATRYPEAVALKGIETERVAEALVDVFSRVGVPREMLTDQGSQFTSNVMKEVSRLLSLHSLTTTPYHPMCNGLVEKFNGTLKQMLRRMCSERPKDWDKYLNPLLFAYREVTQDSLGFSPFEMIYGRAVRGPMRILKELWSKEVDDPEIKSTYEYVMDLRHKLEETCKIAKNNLEKSKKKQKFYYNRKAKDRQMKTGDLVLILLPTKSNKLMLQWRGPYRIVERRGTMDYRVDVGGKVKTYHANLLRQYIDRSIQTSVNSGVLSSCSVAVLNDENEVEDEMCKELFLSPESVRKETAADIHVAEGLQDNEVSDIRLFAETFQDVLSDLPGRTNLAEHRIQLTTTQPIRLKPYPIPFNTKEVIKQEIDKMLEMKVIEPSESPYASPVVLVNKKDGTYRFCIDFRKLNQITIFDAEPIPNMDDIFATLSGHRYFSKIDLSKGYWQVPVAEDSKAMTAFVTPYGLFQFCVMPFGLVNAPATFSRLMRKLLNGMSNVDNLLTT